MRACLLLSCALCLSAAAPIAKETAPATLRVAAVQMRSKADLDANVEQTIRLLERCAADGVDVAVFPECSVSGYFDDHIKKLTAKELADAEARIRKACARLGIWAV